MLANSYFDLCCVYCVCLFFMFVLIYLLYSFICVLWFGGVAFSLLWCLFRVCCFVVCYGVRVCADYLVGHECLVVFVV